MIPRRYWTVDGGDGSHVLRAGVRGARAPGRGSTGDPPRPGATGRLPRVTADVHTIAAGDLENWARAALLAAGADEIPASVTARVLVDANRRGLDTHGVLILRLYLPRLASGAIDGRARPGVALDLPAAAVVDGHNALGPYVASFAIDLCCEKAERQRRGCRRGPPLEPLRRRVVLHRARRAARDCVAMVCSNSDRGHGAAGRAGARPRDESDRDRGARPAGTRTYRRSTSRRAWPRIGRSESPSARASSIPAGWAIGPDGQATEDPAEALRRQPAADGRPQGLRARVHARRAERLPRGRWDEPGDPGDPEGREPQGTGHLVVAIHVPSLAEPRSTRSASARLADAAVHGASRAPGVEPFQIPGEPEARTARARGGAIPFPEGSVGSCAMLGERFGIPFP